MIGYLYRYPHPLDPTKFIYVGQGPKRDSDHRRGVTSFGRRFKEKFLDVELPQPIREQIEVKDQMDLNELETIWMFRFHTWRGYSDGMNLVFPGSLDYQVAGCIGGAISGLVNGRRNSDSGHLKRIANLPQSIKARKQAGRKAVESGQLARILKLPQTIEAHKTSGRKSVESGRIFAMAILGGKKQGLKNAQNGHMRQIQKIGASLGGLAVAHNRHHVGRPNPRCILCSEQSLIVAFA